MGSLRSCHTLPLLRQVPRGRPMVPQPPPVGLGNVDARPGPVTSCGLDRPLLAYDVPAQLGHCPTLVPAGRTRRIARRRLTP